MIQFAQTVLIQLLAMCEQPVYDVIVVGGGPIGLSAAYQCAVKRGKKVLVIEQFTFHNDYASSPGFSRQWRTCYAERQLCGLAVQTSPLWDQLMRELKNDTLLSRTGTLWFGDSTVHNSEGNILAAKENLDYFYKNYELLESKDKISKAFPWIGGAINDVENPIALFVDDGGTINVPEVFRSFNDALATCPNSDLREREVVKSIDYSSSQVIKVSTDKTLYRCEKVILAPGTYVNEVLPTLTPDFPYFINYTIYLWSSTYFQVKDPLTASETEKWPIWYFFGQQVTASDGDPVDYNAYYGFPSDVRDQPGHARVCPAFTSDTQFDFPTNPPPEDQRPLDNNALQFTSNFVERSMPGLDYRLIDDKHSTCIAGFAERRDGDTDDGAGFVLDFVPNTGDRMVLATGGWCMKFVPIMGVMLADMAVDGQTNLVYRDYIQPMNIERTLEPKRAQVLKRPVKLTSAQRAAKFNRMWS